LFLVAARLVARAPDHTARCDGRGDEAGRDRDEHSRLLKLVPSWLQIRALAFRESSRGSAVVVVQPTEYSGALDAPRDLRWARYRLLLAEGLVGSRRIVEAYEFDNDLS
jgi:hypothetical protein